MKEIGIQFKEKRKQIGISVDEVSSDLNIDAVLIDNLEDGNNKVFKDVLELKEIVSNYAKYLGLDSNKLLDELNDYLFEKTSKISIEDIKMSMNKTKPLEKKIKSPYTIEIKPKNDWFIITVIFLIVFMVLVMFYFILKQIFIG